MYINETIAEPKARLNENPNDAEAAATLGNIYRPEGCTACDPVLPRRPRDRPRPTRCAHGPGHHVWHNGDIALAEQAFRRVIADHPGFGNAYINLGHLLREVRKDAAQAREIWRTLAAQYPEDPATAEAVRLLAKE